MNHKFSTIPLNLFVLFLMTILSSTTLFASSQTTNSFNSENESRRFTSLTREIRCPVCQGQSIAESNAPLANDLRNKVYQLISENKSDADIKAYLSARYGNVILLQPPMTGSTWLLWGFPLIAFLTISLFLLRKFYK